MTQSSSQPAEKAASAATAFERITSQPENPFAALITDQSIAIVPEFTLESGVTLYNVPVAYSTRGKLAPLGDNALLICHALSGSADVSDWWGPLLGGPGKAFDISRFYIVCVNSLGSPYGTASPVTYKDGDPSQGRYGPEFPLTTIRDDVKLTKLLLDDLGVKQIASVVGGSMGGMHVLEFAFLGPQYVKTIVPIATAAAHSAWCISWGEAQRQSIYSDPKYDDGYYPLEDPPSTGLAAARMAALLTYRSRDSFELRFGRNYPDASKMAKANGSRRVRPSTPQNEHFDTHNEGHRNVGYPRGGSTASPAHSRRASQMEKSEAAAVLAPPPLTDPQFHGARPLEVPVPSPEAGRPNTYFSAQSYLRYQGDKFTKRFDANCYIAVTRKLDTHDVSRHCPSDIRETSADPIYDALQQIEQPALVLGIESDGLFTFAEQREIAHGIPHSRLKVIDSPEGHDAFLLQFEQVNQYIVEFMAETLTHIMTRPPVRDVGPWKESGLGVTKSSTFGEAEAEDITAW